MAGVAAVLFHPVLIRALSIEFDFFAEREGIEAADWTEEVESVWFVPAAEGAGGMHVVLAAESKRNIRSCFVIVILLVIKTEEEEWGEI